MLPRVLEPEAMDTPEEARDYDAMDHAEVNARFVADFLAAHGPGRGGEVLDVGTGPARIAIALCRADPAARVVGVDLAEAMLALARRNVAEAGLEGRITCVLGDAKGLDWPAGRFEAVLSNTIVHHFPDPAPALAEMIRLVAPGGMLFVRDLARPAGLEDVASLVAAYGGPAAPASRLFEASLHAALTVPEVRDIARSLGLPREGVAMTSDRHWTWTWRRPPEVPDGSGAGGKGPRA
jgi:ubiquinone/menaquinone biosynthesis C-methylase UbiE